LEEFQHVAERVAGRRVEAGWARLRLVVDQVDALGLQVVNGRGEIGRLDVDEGLRDMRGQSMAALWSHLDKRKVKPSCSNTTVNGYEACDAIENPRTPV
jgi:hypothetical protein